MAIITNEPISRSVAEHNEAASFKRNTPKWARQLSRSWSLAKDFIGETVGRTKYESRLLTDEEEIKDAWRLSIGEFVNLDKIAPENLVDGLPQNFNEVKEKTKYFAVFDESDKMVAAVRLLWNPDITINETRMPLDDLPLSSRNFLRSVQPGKLAEIGGLVKRRGGAVSEVATLKVLREMYKFGVDQDITYFTCGLDPVVYDKKFRHIFGSALHLLAPEGQTVVFPGVEGDQVPIYMSVLESFAEQAGDSNKTSWSKRVGNAAVRYYFGLKIPELKSRPSR